MATRSDWGTFWELNPIESNILGNPIESNILGNPIESNILGNATESNILGNPIESNILGNATESNILGNPIESNILGNATESNILGNPIESNILGNPRGPMDRNYDQWHNWWRRSLLANGAVFVVGVLVSQYVADTTVLHGHYCKGTRRAQCEVKPKLSEE